MQDRCNRDGAATIATIAHARGLPWIVANGVMDADATKDDRCKQFAARASAQVVFGLLAQLIHGGDADGPVCQQAS